MKIFKANNLPFCLQSIYMPEHLYRKHNFQTFALIDIAESFRVLAKVRLCDSSLPVNCCFIDSSVVVPKQHWERFDVEDVKIHSSNIEETDILILKSIRNAETVEVILVCTTIGAVIKFKEEELLKDFLIQFLVKPGCIVLGESLPELQCHCVVIKEIGGQNAEIYRITRQTKIIIKRVCSLEMFKQTRLEPEKTNFFKDNDELTLPKITNIVQKVVEKKDKFRHILLVGPTGCGKSSMIQAIAKIKRRVVLSLNCGDVSPTTFSEKLSKMFKDAKLHVKAQEPCVLLLKDIDRICATRNDNLTSNSRQLIREITDHLETIQTVTEISVIATTSSPENIDPSLKRVGSGFNQEIEIPILTETDRENIFKKLCSTYDFDGKCAKSVATWTPGYVLCDFHFLFREAQNTIDESKDQEACFKRAVSVTLPSSLKGTTGLVTSHRTTFDEIGGLENVKKILKMSVLWQMAHPEAFARLGVPPTRGILLYGPPGCAKTTLVKSLAYETKATFIAVSAADIYSCYVGEAEKRIVQLFSQARIGAPSILFIDEIDALVGTKDGDRHHGAQERILATLLLEMDGVGLVLQASNELTKCHENENQKANPTAYHPVNNTQVIVVGATNRPDMIDDALKRPGRFDKMVHVPSPDVSQRFAILQQITSKMALDSSVDLKYVAEKSAFCSGADLKSICTESALYALTTRGMEETKITHSDFTHILQNFRPSLSKTSYRDNKITF